MWSMTRRAALAVLGAAWLAPGRAAAQRPAPVPIFDFAIAGGFYHGLREALAAMRVGDRLILRPEPENRFDGQAIAVFDEAGRKLGYVPRLATASPHAALAEGRVLDARIVGFAGESVPEELRFTGFRVGDPIVRLVGA